MKDEVPLKAAVTVAEMARMVSLSRARFYQLQKAGVFPPPKLNPSTKRPFFDQELQEVCLNVRRRNCGVSGQVVLFYARRQEITPARSKPTPKAVPNKQPKNDLVAALESLGLAVTLAQVERAVSELFPGGAPGNGGEVIRAVFLHLKQRRNAADNVGR